MRKWRWGVLLAPTALAAAALTFGGGGAVFAQMPTATATATATATTVPATATAAPTAAPQSGAPTPPNRFYGNVTLGGSTAAQGTTVVAMVGAARCGSGTVTAGTYVVDVASSFTQAGCGTEGATVTFMVGTAAARETGRFQTGAFTALNLTAVQATPTPPPTVTPATATATRPPTTATVTPATATATRPPVTQTPVVRTPVAQQAAGKPAAQAPRGAAAPAAQAPRPATGGGAVAPAPVAGTGGGAQLPRTGAGVTDTSASMWLALAAVAMLGVGSGLARRRR